jgi:hypothetical protein
MISFDTNNNGRIEFVQHEHDADVLIHIYHDGVKTYGNTIPNGDMVMLYNLYRYIKDNDIQNDFINPNGANKE